MAVPEMKLPLLDILPKDEEEDIPIAGPLVVRAILNHL